MSGFELSDVQSQMVDEDDLSSRGSKFDELRKFRDTSEFLKV